MIVAALCIALGGVTFEKVDIPGIYVYDVHPPSGIPFVNFRHVDIDADGHMDLLLRTRAYLRKEGQLNPDRFIAMPDVPPLSKVDFWESTVYVLSPSAFATYELRDGTWNQTNAFTYEWDPWEGIRAEPNEGTPSIELGRYLHDVDGDGKPEIIRVDNVGVVIGVIHADRIEDSHLDLYRLPKLVSSRVQDTLWPESDRKLSLPNRNATFDVVIDGATAVVVERIRPNRNETTFGIHRYQIAGNGDEGFQLVHEDDQELKSVPNRLHPLMLNNDGTIDIAGFSYTRPTLKNWKPLLRSFASTDGGKTIQVATTRGFWPRALFVDIDNDHDLDWIGEESGLIGGGIRETANRALFQRKFTHTIKARMQNSDGTFESNWRTLGQFSIQLDEPARHYSHRFWQYMVGQLIDCTGDFDGDGWRDALVSSTPDTVSVYLGGPEGFRARAETTFAFPENKSPTAVDIDGDGLSDVVASEPDSRQHVRAIYLNRAGTQ